MSQTPDALSLTEGLAQAVVASEPLNDPQLARLARQGLLDFLACALAGANDPAVVHLEAGLASGGGPCAVFGRGQHADPVSAAMRNACAGHALDFDDVHASVRGHPSTVILPAVLALAGAQGSNGQAVLAAYAVGLEAMARLGLATGTQAYEAGWHHTATLGGVGAAVACAHLLQLTPAQTAVAIGLGATQAQGLQVQFGSEAKPLHAALAARAGLQAALWAQAGLQGSSQALDGPRGFIRIFGGSGAQPERLLQGWGAPWQLALPGLSFKQHACCNATHHAADAALRLHAQLGPSLARVQSVVVHMPPGSDAPLRRSPPANGVEGRFSLPYVVALALWRGALPLQAFSDAPLAADLAARLPLIHTHIDDDAPRVGTDPAHRYAEVVVTLDDGRTLCERVSRPEGAGDSRAKFRSATDDAAAWREVPDRVQDLASTADLRALFEVLLRPATHPLALNTAP